MAAVAWAATPVSRPRWTLLSVHVTPPAAPRRVALRQLTTARGGGRVKVAAAARHVIGRRPPRVLLEFEDRLEAIFSPRAMAGAGAGSRSVGVSEAAARRTTNRRHRDARPVDGDREWPRRAALTPASGATSRGGERRRLPEQTPGRGCPPDLPRPPSHVRHPARPRPVLPRTPAPPAPGPLLDDLGPGPGRCLPGGSGDRMHRVRRWLETSCSAAELAYDLQETSSPRTPAPATASVAGSRGRPRRPRLNYTNEEVLNLLRGVRKYGKDFKAIRLVYEFHPSRTTVDLYDKWRHMQRHQAPVRPAGGAGDAAGSVQ